MNALVIGAGGFVGKYLVAALQAGGWSVSVTKLPFERLQIEGCEAYDVDVSNREQIADVLKKARPNVIFHLAALSSVMLSWKNIRKTFEINTIGAINLLDAVREHKRDARVLLIGSSEEYGFSPETKMPVSEDAPVNPDNPYAISKHAQSCLGKMYAGAFGMDVVTLRAFNHIGPGQPSGFVVPDFCRQIAAIERSGKDGVILTGNLEAKRDFTDVRDITKGYVACAEKARSGEIYNIGSGRALSIRWVLDYLCSLSGANVTVKADPEKFRPIEIPLIVADVAKVTAETGWKPQHRIEESLENVLNYWRNMQDIERQAPAK